MGLRTGLAPHGSRPGLRDGISRGSTQGSETLRTTNLTVRFLLEVGALVAVAYWGATVPGSGLLRAGAAVAAPAILALAWGLFISPKARWAPGPWAPAALGLVVFTVAALALWHRGQETLAATFWLVAVASSGILVLRPQ